MRKFTKFFMLLFALVGATVGNAQTIAESPTKISELTSGFYVIKNVNPDNQPANVNNYYIYCENTENGALKLTATKPSADVTDPAIDKYLWYVDVKPTGAGENVTVTISSVFQTGYWPVAQTGNKSLVVTDDPQVFDLKTKNQELNGKKSAMTEDGNTCLIGNTTSYDDKDGNPQTYSYFHINEGNNIGSWHNANHESLLYAQFYAATDIAKKLTLNCTDSKLNNTFTKVATFVSYSPLSLADLRWDFYTVQSVKNASDETVNEITKSGGTYTVNCTSNFPFEVMTITDGAFANANFYTMMIVNGNRDVVYNSDTHIHTVSGTKGFNKESLWAFELIPGTEANFRIYNFSLGAGQCIYKNGTNDGPVAMGSTSSSSNTKFTLFKNDTGYGFFIPGTPTACLNASQNQNGEGSNSSLGIWNNNDSPTNNGSRFTFTSVNDMVPETPYSGGYGQDKSYTSAEGYVTLSNAAAITALYSYNNNPTSSWLGQAIDNVANADGFDFNDLYNLGTDAAKIYQIIAYGEACKDQPIYANPSQTAEGAAADNNRTLYTGAMAPVDKTAQTAMFLVKEGTNYYIEHANSEYWFSNINDNSFKGTPDLPMEQQYSAPYTIHPAGYMSNVFALKIASADKWLACGGDNNTLTVVTEEPTTASNANGYWLIKEIKSIPVEISAAKWSTLCLPVAVEVPDDANLKVYTVSGVDNAGVMTLNEVPAGTIVAKKTGLLLASTSENGGKYNFAVSTEAGMSYEGNNILMGTTARRIGFNTETPIPHYALAQIDDVVAFYPSTLNILPANKAYIKEADITSGGGGDTNRALYMTGNTTGVDSTLIQNGETEEYYDLNGRRVLYPTTGIYATRSGKKVFIK